VSRLSRTLVFLLFLAPYVFSLIVAQGRMALPAGFLGLVQSSFLQAALSALFAVTLGILTGVGLLGLPQRLRRSTEAAVLVGSFVPSIAWVLMWMVLLPNVRGVTAIVILHAVSSAGLIASAVVRKVRTRWAGSLELAMVEGAPRGLMWRRGLLPLLRSDLVTYLLTIFASSLSSFSIPLLMGGAEAWTFEIAIHQAVRIHSAWDQVAALTL
jgi:ABC-type Fe3+ transport system permease subunit